MGQGGDDAQEQKLCCSEEGRGVQDLGSRGDVEGLRAWHLRHGHDLSGASFGSLRKSLALFASDLDVREHLENNNDLSESDAFCVQGFGLFPHKAATFCL